MFEKEAEERANRLEEKQTLGVYDNDEDLARDKGFNEGQVVGYEKGFKEGAEFGYNKANEWHYVKDEDLPKAYQKCYFIHSNCYKGSKVDFSESSINVLTGLYAYYLDEETGEITADPCFYDVINDDEISLSEVYAWKEIVLPELKDSE